ncbi:MAG TPA: transposase [Desulfotomaculum sp.]|nr:MAG: transposase [Desulfotomaculum sp. 46_80]KUK84835.1 MAG: transposase [Desulfofundulus kuznetsovii]HAG10484.1 transposase [Desulfotomaculum sp.]
MPRHARKKGEFSTYHIIQRGNERKNLFNSSDDKTKFLDTLKKIKEKYNFTIYAYCLMDNHVHLIIDDNGNDISKIIKSINISYVYYFNKKYRRCGHLFQDRFKSELIDNDGYLLEVSKYIHNNPTKARLVKTPSDYKWSSYNIYLGKEKDVQGLINTGKILGCISERKEKAIKRYMEFVTEQESTAFNFMDLEDEIDEKNSNYICTIEQAQKRLMEIIEEDGILYADLLKNIKARDELIKTIRKNSSLTLKQIGELFGGISESWVSRILSS